MGKPKLLKAEEADGAELDMMVEYTPVLNDLNDLEMTGVLNGEMPAWNSTTGKYEPSSAAANAVQLFQMAFVTDNSTYKSIGGGSYTDVVTFRFPGTDKIGAISNIILVAGNSRVAPNASSYRILDISNSNNIIAEVTGVTGIAPVEIDMGAVSNLPTASAIWVLQAKTDDAGNKARVASISYEY